MRVNLIPTSADFGSAQTSPVTGPLPSPSASDGPSCFGTQNTQVGSSAALPSPLDLAPRRQN